MAWEERMHTIERYGKSELEQKLLTPASRDNAIKTDVVVVFVVKTKFDYWRLIHEFHENQETVFREIIKMDRWFELWLMPNCGQNS